MNHTVFYGLEAQYWYFYTDSKLMYNPGFWMLQNEKVALGKAVDVVKSDKNAVLVDFTHSMMLALRLQPWIILSKKRVSSGLLF